MDNGDELKIRLEAYDDATPNLERVEEAFDNLRRKYESVTKFMAENGLDVNTAAGEASIRRMEGSIAGAFEKIKDYDEAVAARILAAQNRMLERQQAATARAAEAMMAQADRIAEASLAADRIQEQSSARLAEKRIEDSRRAERELEAFDARVEQAAAKAAAQQQAAAQRVFQTQRSQMESHVEAYLAGERLIADSAAKAAQDQILSNRRAERDLEDFDARLAKFAQQRAQRDARSAEDTFFFVQEANAKIIASDERRAAEEARLAEQAARRAASAAGAAGEAGGGIGGAINGIAGRIPGLAMGALGAAGNAAGGIMSVLGGAAQGGLNLLMAPIRGIGEAFSGIMGSIAGAGRELINFITIGAGLYGGYQIVMQLQQAFSTLKEGVLGFQDVMVRVASLTGAATGEMANMSAAVLQVSMSTGRSATELGEAMYFIESHGIKGADALNILAKAGQLSAAGLGETNKIVRVVAGQMLAYNEVLDGTARSQEVAAHYFDVFARTVQISAVPADEVANTFARITPLASALHVGIEELGADFATISQTGLNASRVMTDLIAVFNNFLKGGKQQQEALKGIGLSVDAVRKTLGEKGLIAAAEQIWQAADRDINAVSQVFGDRTRALVGYLALVEDGGRRADENLAKMQHSAGTTAAVFEAALTRVSVQWQRFTNIIQAFAIAAGSTVLPGIAADLNKINDALQNADFSGAANGIVVAFQHAGETIMGVLDSLGKSMFGAGMTMMETLAQGIFEGINSVLNAAVTAVADFIGGFLLGHSWPPRGPLSNGDAGVHRWQEAHAQAMESGKGIMAGAAANVATAVNDELGKIGGGMGSKTGLEVAIANIDQQLLPWKLAVEDIKNSYEAQLHPLEMQISALQRIKDLEYERQQLKFAERDLDLRMMHLRAEGDPQRRAQLAGQMAVVQERQEQHSIEARIATLNRESATLRPGRGTSPQEIAARRREIADELQILGLQRQQHKLVNVELLGQYETKKAQLDVDKEGAAIAHDRFDMEQKKALQPLLEQRDKLKAQEQAELDVIDQQTQGLENQRKILEAHLRLVNAVTAANKAGAAGSGASPWRMPETGGIADDLGAGISKTMQKGIDNLANEFSGRLSTGVHNFFAANGPRVGAGLVGSIIGGMVGGIPGAIGGAVFGARLLDALQERGVTGADLQRFADRVMGSLKGAFARVQTKLSAHDFLGAVEEVMVTARAWIAEFQTSFFREWTTTTLSHSEGETTAVTHRWTGLGRTIIEGMFGKQDRELNFQVAYDLVNENVITPAKNALQKAWADFTAPTDLQTNAAGARDVWYGAGMGPSQAEQMGHGILSAIEGAFKWVSGNLGAPVAAAGDALGKVFQGAVTFITTDAQTKEAMGQAFETLGNDLAVPFLKGLGKGILGGIGAVLSMRVGGGAPALVQGGGYGAPLVSSATPGAATISGPEMPGAGAPGLIKQAVDMIPVGLDAVKGFIAGLTGSEADTAVNEGARLFGANVLQTIRFALDSHSPSREMAKIGMDAVEGFNQGLADASDTTAPVVRMWLRADVIAQARSILITGEGKTGGLAAVGIDALAAFGEAFATPPPALATNMRALGQTVVDDIMDPIVDPRTGIIARMQRQIDAMPKAPRHPVTEDTLPTPEANQRYAATGADFIVGGSGGTDSQQVNLWATPGERVQVGANGAGAGAGRQITNHFNITVNGGDPEEVQQAIAEGVRAGLSEQGDTVPGELLNAWRTAKAQGVNRPIGVQSRGARG